MNLEVANVVLRSDYTVTISEQLLRDHEVMFGDVDRRPYLGPAFLYCPSRFGCGYEDDHTCELVVGHEGPHVETFGAGFEENYEVTVTGRAVDA